MAKTILPPKESKKTKRKLLSQGVPAKDACIPITRDELFQLFDIADALKLLRDLVEEAPELQLIQVEIVITKASRCAWNLVYETLESRWQGRHPNIDLIRKN